MMLPAPIKDTDSSSSSLLPQHTCQLFTFAEIQSATNNFDEKLVIGRGGFGKVYRCPKIGSVSEVVIKHLHSMSNQGAHEFDAEVKILSKLRHGNLVSLLGYCNEGNEMALVYEFMLNGTLEDHLQKTDSFLSWLQRLKVCIGAARGLDYLHTGTSTQHGVIHRDVKSSNILLDANFAAKISDFGLAKVSLIDGTRTHVSTAVKGTFGYMDPCYFYTGKLTRKSDIYAFGVVLFEVLTGRKALDPSLEEQWGLAGWAQHQIKQGKLNQIIDPRLIGQISRKCLKEFAKIADQCLHTQPKRRPTMAELVFKLESILSQESAIASSVVDEEGFVYKLRSLFTGKVDAIVESNTNQSYCRPFTYVELVRATNVFKYKEHSPSLDEYIYKGWVDESTYAPTKPGVGLAMYVRKIQFPTWKRDITLEESNHHLKLEEFNHPNLVKLLGYCWNKQDLYSVYELIPSTSLDTYLYGEPDRTSLSWVARLKISIGAAEGLLYLHKRNQNKPVYSQFKTNRILVDTEFNARLSDFAFDSYTSRKDEYFGEGDVYGISSVTLSHKDGLEHFGEIYAFGVVLLEILAGKKVYDKRRPLGKQDLVEWAIPLLTDEVNFEWIMDPHIRFEHDGLPKGAFIFAQLVSKCLILMGSQCPSMEENLGGLASVLSKCNQHRKSNIIVF